MNKSYYAIIPAEIRYHKTLKPNAKLLYGEITALCNEKGFCWASNAYFAQLYEVQNTTISEWITSLKDTGFLEIMIDQKKGNQRQIYLTNYHDPIGKKPKTSSGKAEDLSTAESEDPLREKPKHNNTENNTVINNTDISPSAKQPDDIRKVFDIFYRTINPNINFGHKPNRAAAEWLVKKYGLEKTLEAARYAVSVYSETYAPNIATPSQLKDKMPSLIKHKLKGSKVPAGKDYDR